MFVGKSRKNLTFFIECKILFFVVLFFMGMHLIRNGLIAAFVISNPIEYSCKWDCSFPFRLFQTILLCI